jgi:leucyl aminopeptidase (aminopeptidase T)
MDNRLAEIVKTAMVPYRLNLNAGDRVLIVTDTSTDPLLTQAFTVAAVAVDALPVVTMRPPLPYHHADLDPITLAAMDEADLVHLLTTRATLHSPTGHRKQLEGVKFLASEQLTVAMLQEGAATADYEAMGGVAQQLYDVLQEGKSIHLTTPGGTDIVGDITGRPSWICAGRVEENPGLDLNACGFPDGEVGMAPIEETIEGTVVWDVSMHHCGLIEEPIVARVERGSVVSIEGGAEARALEAFLEANGDEGSRIVCETAIGINERARITGLVREDKKAAGTAHVALGMNTDTGGVVASRTHLDGVMRNPTVVVDGRTLVREGELQVSR